MAAILDEAVVACIPTDSGVSLGSSGCWFHRVDANLATFANSVECHGLATNRRARTLVSQFLARL